MGSVYRATHLQLERSVAIKILRAEFLEDPVVAERFNREARAAARLKHPNIVAVYDFGMLPNGGAYLVMELIEGRSLREELRTHAAGHGQMRPERAAAILAQVCAGIEAAHRHGIIHRDLKPDNVMIENAAEAAERVLVLDFGIAKLKDRDQGMREITDENTIIGTPNYISPEQCTGQSVDARSDVYSLGVILYEMLTGRTPFAGQNTSAVLLRHLQEPPAPPSRFRPALNRELENVALRALAKNPSHRFSSAAQFAEHLVAAVKSSPRHVEEEIDGEVETLARRPAMVADEITRFEPRDLAGAMSFDPPNPTEDSLENAITRPPTLLIERPPRTRFYAAVAAAVLALIGFFAYLWVSEWRAAADESSGQSAAFADNPARPENQTTIARPNEATAPNNTEPGGKKTLPASFEKNEPPNVSSDERALREVKAIYAEWTAAAARGDWNRHMSFYADRIDYFRDGVLTRPKVEARKRQIFGRLNSYSLKFTGSPQIQLLNRNGAPEADVVFDRQWRLKRGRKRVEGKARGLITLRREARGWRIVSEKQIRK
jgi:serine/threonine protein kinase/ketosteroid isomerase-like protein